MFESPTNRCDSRGGTAGAGRRCHRKQTAPGPAREPPPVINGRAVPQRPPSSEQRWAEGGGGHALSRSTQPGGGSCARTAAQRGPEGPRANSPKLTHGLCHTGGGGAALLEAANQSKSGAKQPPLPPPNPLSSPSRAAQSCVGAGGSQQLEELRPLCRWIPSPTKESTWCHRQSSPLRCRPTARPVCSSTSFGYLTFR